MFECWSRDLTSDLTLRCSQPSPSEQMEFEVQKGLICEHLAIQSQQTGGDERPVATLQDTKSVCHFGSTP